MPKKFEQDLENKFAVGYMKKYNMAPGELCSRCDFSTIYIAQQPKIDTSKKRIDNKLELFDEDVLKDRDPTIYPTTAEEHDQEEEAKEREPVHDLQQVELSANYVDCIKQVNDPTRGRDHQSRTEQQDHSQIAPLANMPSPRTALRKYLHNGKFKQQKKQDQIFARLSQILPSTDSIFHTIDAKFNPYGRNESNPQACMRLKRRSEPGVPGVHA